MNLSPLDLTPEHVHQLQSLHRPEQAIRLLTGQSGPLSSDSSAQLDPDVARLAYLCQLAWAYGYAVGILRGKMPGDARDIWTARIRVAMQQPGPMAFATELWAKLGLSLDGLAMTDRRFLLGWDREMEQRRALDGHDYRAVYWPRLQAPAIVSEAIIGAELLRPWLRGLKAAPEPDPTPSDEEAETLAMLTPAQRLKLGPLPHPTA